MKSTKYTKGIIIEPLMDTNGHESREEGEEGRGERGEGSAWMARVHGDPAARPLERREPRYFIVFVYFVLFVV